LVRGEDTRWGERGVGVNILEDASHRIGLLQLSLYAIHLHYKCAQKSVNFTFAYALG